MRLKNIILCGMIIAMGMCVHFLFTKPLIAAEFKEISIPVQGYVGSTNPEESSESGEIKPIYVQTSDSNSGWIPMIAILMSSILFVYIVVNKGLN